MIDRDAALDADARELRAQAVVLEHSESVIRSVAETFTVPTDQIVDDELSTLVARSLAVVTGTADGIADGIAQLSEFVHAQAATHEEGSQ